MKSKLTNAGLRLAVAARAAAGPIHAGTLGELQPEKKRYNWRNRFRCKHPHWIPGDGIVVCTRCGESRDKDWEKKEAEAKARAEAKALEQSEQVRRYREHVYRQIDEWGRREMEKLNEQKKNTR